MTRTESRLLYNRVTTPGRERFLFMSKAFLKDDAQDEQIVVAARPPLPPGTLNYVTPRGLQMLQTEHAELTAEGARLEPGKGNDAHNDTERARRLAALRERLEGLESRLSSVQVVQTAPQGEVGFGATVTVRTLSGKFAGEERRFTVVGVDEAAADENRVAFTAPIVRALMGHKVGEQAQMETARGKQTLEVVAVDYEEA